VSGAADEDGPPRRRLYGRSRGKALRAGQAKLLAERLPQLEIAPRALADPASLFPSPVRELWLEIGFGGGEHLIAQAKANPDVGLIGCEPFVNGVAKVLAGIAAERLANVRLRTGDALSLLEAAPDTLFSRVFILYPDPWPKRRHHKRRIVNQPLLEQLARTMRAGAELRFASDIDDYVGWTLRRILDAPGFQWLPRLPDDWRRPWPGWTATRYETKARLAGRTSSYLTFTVTTRAGTIQGASLASRPVSAKLKTSSSLIPPPRQRDLHDRKS
jgi:tRNA (guanine-N7-)-methyltransferase